MKKVFSVLAIAVSMIAVPAIAQDEASTFTGPRVGAVVGFFNDDFVGTDAFTYGANIGYDFDAGGAVLGASAEWQDTTESTGIAGASFGREISVTARAGGKVGNKALIYALGGYTNVSAKYLGFSADVDGYRVGAGVEVAAGRNFYVNLEQRYSDYADGVGHAWQTALGAGFRF